MALDSPSRRSVDPTVMCCSLSDLAFTEHTNSTAVVEQPDDGTVAIAFGTSN